MRSPGLSLERLGSRGLPVPAWLGPLSTDCIGGILHVVDLCRPVLREVPGLDRSVGRAAVLCAQ